MSDAIVSGDVEPSSPVEAALLTEPARKRLAGYVLQAIRQLPPKQVPAALRFAADWRPVKLKPAAVERVIAALGSGDARTLVASHLVEREAAAAAFAEGERDTADRSGQAALLFLLRPPGWEEELAALVGAQASDVLARDTAALRQQVDALQRRLDSARQRHEQALARVQAESAKRSAGLAEKAGRLQAQLDQLKEELRAERAAHETLKRKAGDLEGAVRRLRKQLESQQQTDGQRKASEKAARIAANARAKVLLDVLAKAAAGLAEELQVPVGTPLPADLVGGAEAAQVPRGGRIGSAAALGEELTLPGCHLVVDGYNVTKGAWPSLSLQDQREMLVKALAALASRTGAEVTVVFDGAAVGRAPAYATRSVRVRFSEPGELADQLVVRLVAADTTGRPLVVVSSDAAVVSGAIAAGARTADRECLLGLLGRSSR